MKFIFLWIILSPLLLLSQQSSLTEFISFSPADSNRSQVNLSGKMFELMSNIAVDSLFDRQMKEMAEGIAGMEAYLEFSTNTGLQALSKLEDQEVLAQYASYSREDGKFIFYVAEKDGIISEIIMIALNDNQAFAASIYGAMDIRNIGLLYRLVRMNGFNYLDENKID